MLIFQEITNYQLKVISFSPSQKPSNLPKIWPEASWLISKKFLQSGFCYWELWRIKQTIKKCFFGIFAQYAQGGTVKVNINLE